MNTASYLALGVFVAGVSWGITQLLVTLAPRAVPYFIVAGLLACAAIWGIL